MHILFIDIDGVLHPTDATDHSTGWFCWLHVLFALLEPHPEVRLVVHSSWRYEYEDAELRQLLGPVGKWFSGSAPRMRREQAIHAVLQANKAAVASYLVLDDDVKEFEGSSLNVVFCDSKLGISEARVQALVAAWLSSTAPH